MIVIECLGIGANIALPVDNDIGAVLSGQGQRISDAHHRRLLAAHRAGSVDRELGHKARSQGLDLRQRQGSSDTACHFPG